MERTDRYFIFKTLGHYHDLTDMRGGFHRKKGSIFVNLSLIPANEWMIIFIHELIHKLDLRMKKAVDIFSDKKTIEKLFEWGELIEDPNDLTVKSRERLRAHIMAGLDRGLLGEYRAWVITFSLYKEGLKYNMWKNIKWIDSILDNCRNENFKACIYHFLDERFDNPERVSIFSIDLVYNELLNIRKELLLKNDGPSLGTSISCFLTN